MIIIGIHDTIRASLFYDNKLICAVTEERFTRKKMNNFEKFNFL